MPLLRQDTAAARRLGTREQALDLLRVLKRETLARLGKKSKLGSDRLWRAFHGRRRLTDQEVLDVFGALTSDDLQHSAGEKYRKAR